MSDLKENILRGIELSMQGTKSKSGSVFVLCLYEKKNLDRCTKFWSIRHSSFKKKHRITSKEPRQILFVMKQTV